MVPSKLLKRISQFIVVRPTPILIVLAAATSLAVFETRKIRFDFSPQSVNIGDRDALEFAEQFKRTFRYEDALIFVALEATGENDALDASALEWQAKVAGELKDLPHVSAVEALPTLELPQFNFADLQNVNIVPAVDRIPVDTETENRLRRLVDGSRMLQGTLVSADRKVGAMIVSVDETRRDLKPMREDVAAVRGVLDANPPPEGYRYALAGLPILRTDIVDSLQGEQMFLLPIAALFFVVVLTVVFRRLSGTLVPMLAVGVGMAWTVGVMGATGQSFSILSNMLPVLLMIIGVSNSVHIVCRYAEESRRFPQDRQRATIETIEQMAVACLLTFITTAIGFGSLASARSEILRDFGWQAALGVLLMYVALMLVMGTLLRYFRAPGTGATASNELSPISRGMSAFANAVARHPIPSVSFVIAVVAASFWVSRNLTVNSSMIETYEAGHPTVESLRLVDDKLGGILPIEVSLTSDETGQFLKPAIYRKVAEFSEIARQEPAVLFARSYVDIHQDVYANFRKQPELFHEWPADNAEGAARIRRTMNQIERAGEAIPYHVFVARDGEQARILVRVRDVGTRELLALIERLEGNLGSLFPPESHVTFRLTGDAYLNARSMDGFVRDLFVSLVTAAVTIFALISILFRSLGLGLIAAIPNITPLAVTLGYMGLRGYDLNAGNVIVFTISLGIAVDDTIHFLTRYREEMAKENNVWKAIERSYHGTGRAIVLMTLLIVCGLSVLFLSDFVPTRRFAELTTVTMVAALFGDLLLLPASLVLFRKRKPATKAPIPEPHIAGSPVGRREHAPTRSRRESG